MQRTHLAPVSGLQYAACAFPGPRWNLYARCTTAHKKGLQNQAWIAGRSAERTLKEGSAFQPADNGTRRCLQDLADLSQAGKGRSKAPTVMRKANSVNGAQRTQSTATTPDRHTAARVDP